jgi:Icc-related predicted phosphoesterase
MKILCIADHIDPLVYSAGIKERFRDVGLVLSSGDLPLNYYDFIVSTLNKPLLFVFGNHNLRGMEQFRGVSDAMNRLSPLRREAEAPATGAVYVNGRVRREKGVLVAGLGGSRWYNGGANQYTDMQTYLRLALLAPRLLFNRLRFGRYLDVLLTHAPPLGVQDAQDPCHRGFRALLWFMRVFKPRYLVHGHIHLYSSEAPRTSRYGQTTVVNAYNHALIEVPT